MILGKLFPDFTLPWDHFRFRFMLIRVDHKYRIVFASINMSTVRLSPACLSSRYKVCTIPTSDRSSLITIDVPIQYSFSLKAYCIGFSSIDKKSRV